MGIGGSRFTGVRSGAWLLVAGIATALFYGILAVVPTQRLVELFTERGVVQYVTVLFFFWAILMLWIKHIKISRQHAALGYDRLVPADPDFVLSPGTVKGVLTDLHRVCVDPSQFILFNRIEFALSNLKNMGRISDVDEVLRSKAENDVDVMESSYTLVRGLIWAIPVLGFIGTVQGLSGSLGSFGQVLVDTDDFASIKPALKEVTAGLSTAFDTTFVALVAALLVQLLLTFVRKREEDLLDACNEYCQRHIVGRLRLTPFDVQSEG
ncbi:MAG: MotA/TolQ/ExbB proton channel family protein [Planctomycetota bacterium]